MSRELSLAEVFQLGYYWETKILLTAVKLDVFSAIDTTPKSAQEIAERVGADASMLGILLHALAAMKILNKQDERFGNSSAALTHLVRHSPQYVGHLLLLHDAEWNNWGRLEETIRTGQRMVDRHVFETDPELGSNVLTVLNRIGKQSGPDLARRLKLTGKERILDLGGGAGTNAIAFCQVHSEMAATVFDLPATLRLTEKTVKDAGLEARIRLLPGDFNSDPLGGPYDLVLMSDILHYQTFEMNRRLVEKSFASLGSGGRLVIKDRFLEESGAGPAWTTAFAVHILVNTQHGSCYRASDAVQWMTAAGFGSVTELEKTAVVQGVKNREA